MNVLDPLKNFIITTVATAPSPATSGTSLVVNAGDGALFPVTADGEYNAVVFPTGENALSTNAEIIRITARTTDTLTIQRSQEGTSARSIIVGDIVMVGLTAKTINDIDLALKILDINTDQSGGTSDTYGALSGTINGTNKVFTVSAGSYISGTLSVYLNGQLLTQGSSEDWVETTPASGTFTFDVAPVSGDEILVMYRSLD